MGKAEALWIRILSTIHLLLLFAFVVHGQPGFMNIDCGKPRGYTYNIKGLIYESDYEYVDTGVTQNISSTLQSPNYYLQRNDVRSFPSGTWNCFSLTPVSPGKKYLVRAAFMYGNYDGKNYFPRFDLYLGTIYWETISISNSTAKYATTIYTVASSNYMSVCLMDIGSGTPFVTVIELRPLDDDVYIQLNASNSVSLVSVDLVNLGGSTNRVVRYPKDAYDRVWRSYVEPEWTRLYTTSNVSSTSKNFNPPVDVMQTAVAPTSGSTLNFSIMLGDSSPGTLYHVFMHFAELQGIKQNGLRAFTISMNGLDVYYNLRPEYLRISSACFSKSTQYEKLDFLLYMTNGSTLPPLINAIEVYKVRESQQVTTRIEDGEAIRDIKGFYHLKKNWTGDPCAPRKFTWDGLVCSYGGSPRITTLNLRASGLSGIFRVSICNLTELQELDLSTNKLTGNIPNCLGELQHLRSLNLINSGLKGPVPKSLLDKSRNGSLVLSFDENSISPREKKRNVIVIAIATSFSIGLLVVIVLGILWKLRSQRSSDVEFEKESEEKSEVSENQNVPTDVPKDVPKDVPRNAIR